MPGVEVTVVAESQIPDWRQNCGWSLPDYGGAELIVAPNQAQRHHLLANVGSYDVNVFSGTGAYPLVRSAFQASLKTDTTRGIMSEGSDWRGGRGVLRTLRARVAARQFVQGTSFVLTMGHLAESWYRRIGFPADRLYRYGYFVAGPSEPVVGGVGAQAKNHVELVFVGQLIRRKGVDLLLAALHMVNCDSWQLTVVGDGAERKELVASARRLGLGARVRFLGTLENAEAMRVVAAADLLVLPSRWDGWGAVTNEALMRGVPAVCSDFCGSTDLLRDVWRGGVFRSGDVTDLASTLRAWIEKGPRTPEQRQQIVDWSARIEPSVSAKYILSVIRSARKECDRPSVPWLD